MASNLKPYRYAYAALVRLFPAVYQQRFGESMEQTFHDVLRERTESGGVLPAALSLYLETATSLIKEHIHSFYMKNINLLFILGAVGLLLLVPLIAMQFSDEVVWTPLDFLFAGVVLSGAGLTFELVSRQGGSLVYRAAVAAAVAAGLLLVWVNAAVGIIGDEHPANMLYGAVLFLAIVGLIVSRFQPLPLSRAMFAVALAQVAVPVMAYLIWPAYVATDMSGAVGATIFFCLLWVSSGLLFQQAAQKSPKLAT